MVCSVCEGTDLVDKNATSDENTLVSCKQCGVVVHENCYGIPVLDELNWNCSFCASGEDETKKKCELCPNKDGALKRRTKGKWVHILCALYHPHSIITDIEKMEPININKIPSRYFGFNCHFCNSGAKKGACVKCVYTKCPAYVHVTCAQAAGTLREIKKKTIRSVMQFFAIDTNQKRASDYHLNVSKTQ